LRTAFAQALSEVAAADPRVWLLNADLGYSVLEPFAQRFPDRYLNVGVAEQNMIGVAAGLAMTGKVVFTYSIANFAFLRCLEQIRNDVCYHGLSVKVVAVGGGLTYGPQGYSHHGIEDLAMLRSLPNLVVAAPADPVEARLVTRAAVERAGPWYVRLGKAGEPVVHAGALSAVTPGRAIRVQDGDDAALLSTGGMLKTAIEAAEILAGHGRRVAVLSFPFVRPLDEDAVLEVAGRVPVMATLEEAVPRGGFGGAVAEVVAGRTGRTATVLRLGIPESFVTDGIAYGQAAARAKLGLDPAGVAARVLKALAET
jgi:transketolase